MRRFTQLIMEMDRSNRTSDKLAAMERYFREAPAPDAAWAVFFLSGERLKRAVKTAVIAGAALEATGLPDWLVGECYEATGDLSEAIALLLPEPVRPVEVSLRELVEGTIVPLARTPDEDARRRVREAWGALEADQRFVFNKLIRGNFRLGVNKRLVVRAIASAAGIEPEIIAHRLTGGFRPTPDAYRALFSADGNQSAGDASRPYPFCLAQALPPGTTLESLGPLELWHVEFKWDGIRAQVIRRSERAVIWSRGEESVGEQFPELIGAAGRLPIGTVLDGEVLMWRREDAAGAGGRPLSFNALQTRLNRKDVQPGLFATDELVFLAFDLLEMEGADQRSRPLRERLAALAEIISPVQAATGGVIRLAAPVKAASWDEVARLRSGAREEHGAEGVMLKHVDSRYHVGRIAAGPARPGESGADVGWWKWKSDPFSVDAVLIAAQQGSGRRAGLYTDYTFGVWDPAPGPESGLVPFAKAYSGLDNDEIAKVDAFVRRNTISRHGPVRMVEPRLVFEIAFEGIRASDRHRSGVAVRFPRIARWRTDKAAADADTIDTVRGLIREDDAGGSRGKPLSPKRGRMRD